MTTKIETELTGLVDAKLVLERIGERLQLGGPEGKRALEERGPVWWTDGSPDLNRRMVATTPYKQWFAELPSHG